MKIHYEIWKPIKKNRGIFLFRDFLCVNLGDKTLALNFKECMKFYNLGIEAYDIYTACLHDGKKAGCVDIPV